MSRASRLLRDRLRQRVIVTCKNDESFAGVLFEADDRSLVLREPVALGARDDRSHVPLDGEMLILLADVAYLQRP